MNDSIVRAKEATAEYWKKAAPRERALIAGSGSVAIVLVFVWIVGTTLDVFAAQHETRLTVKKEVSQVSVLLKNYLKNRNRKREIERDYQEVELQEGALSLS